MSKFLHQMLVKSEAITLPEYGKEPKDRTGEALLQKGVICLDKPAGPTSHQVTAWVKQILKIERAGHGGTLDPKVTGVLPIALNDATKALETLLIGRKEYVCIMQLHKEIDKEQIVSVINEFIGEIYQLPPVRSAVKRGLRKRFIYNLEILEIESRKVLFKVECDPGTYIRTLCNDIGDALGFGAHMEELRRTKSSSFGENEAITLQGLKDIYDEWQQNKNDAFLKKVIHPMERLLEHLPYIKLKDSAVDAVCHGANLAIPGISEVEKTIKINDVVALLTLKGEGIAIGMALMDTNQIMKAKEGFAVDTKRVLMVPGTYPKLWRKKAKV